jgi:hypothetical protein
MNGRNGPPQQQVRKAPVQPGLAGRVIVPAVNRLLQHVRRVAAEPSQFLMQPIENVRHEVVVTAIPKLVAMREAALHPHARRLDDCSATGSASRGGRSGCQ